MFMQSNLEYLAIGGGYASVTLTVSQLSFKVWIQLNITLCNVVLMKRTTGRDVQRPLQHNGGLRSSDRLQWTMRDFWQPLSG